VDGHGVPVLRARGALALDVLVVLVVTSLLRARLGHRAWRVVHTASYVLWPLAVRHALGSGSDMHASTVRAIGLTCVALVLAGAGWRLLTGRSRPATRLAGLAALLAVTLVVSGWAGQGPLARGWAKRAAAPAGTSW
jgi:sulfoxide reductase heme-binding subunit YedZ